MSDDNKADRKAQLMSVVCDDLKEVMENTVDKIVFLEGQMEELEKLPFIRYNPKNTMQQKITPAAKMYKEYFQQYLNAIKVLEKAARSEDKQTLSPLREWAIKQNGDMKDELQ